MMTMPHERTRSIIQTRDFLVDLSHDQALPDSIRNEARRLLRHYPTSNEILLAGKVEEQMKNGLAGPFLSSTIDKKAVPKNL
ncbi:BPSL0761 family protein [Pseudomonas sp. GL-B-16]|uniref:BPSL0761 family protein n=1 Tax=Pseudomonas sp. GL-B-16 TaxID=2832373 RepID=UPI0029586C25|nr:BPSL0761 family protein [Pseudomonas sp. GL-B-16]